MAVLLRRLILIAACLAVAGIPGAVSAAEPSAGRAAILVSSTIRPYLEAAEGAADTLQSAGGIAPATFQLDKYPANDLSDLSRSLSAEAFDLLIAVGPAAARFAWSLADEFAGRRLYAMVLDPEKVIGAATPACGVSLNIPVTSQLTAIRSGLPAVRRLGVLFDPSHNRGLPAEAGPAAAPLGLSIVPLAVSSKTEIPRVLEGAWDRVDALWLVPDRTVISESIVEYVIRESIYRKVPVIGYNRFFYDSGSSLAFVIDYREVGAASARQAVRVMNGETCGESAPPFQLWVNTRVMDRLGATPPTAFEGRLREGP
jgi:putative ABC transport system substrate-binding protein